MIKLAFFDTKQYDRDFFDKLNHNRYDITYFEEKLNERTAILTTGYQAVCAFVNDDINGKVIEILFKNGIKVIVMRCAGYSNIDFKACYKKINILRVPAYSPHAVAEHALALLLTLNRKIHKAYIRTRDFNFSLTGLQGIDLYQKTVGVIGTGKIGQAFISCMQGLGMKVLAYDKYPQQLNNVTYVNLDELLKESDVISLHCPLTEETHHLINEDAFTKMKKGVFLINTSRGALVDTNALLKALNEGIVRGVGLDVYEEEADLFFEDYSSTIIKDDTLALLVSKPNVILTSHQAFFTFEALENIAQTTLQNLDDFFNDKDLQNEICYHCGKESVGTDCPKKHLKKCF